jgi:putative two-component system response regulator
VLDDDELIVRALSRVLRRVGLTVEHTTDPDEAMAIARREPPDVIVSDLHMPRACGAIFLASVARVAPAAMRVVMSADPDFRPEIGAIAAARVHALMSKSELPKLGNVLVAQLRGRLETPEDKNDREELARRIANALSRPSHEDEAHRERVLRWSTCVATAMGLPSYEVEQARLGAILHDVGQIALREVVFSRNGPLTKEEHIEINEHPKAGARIVEEMPALRGALAVISAHHERLDGEGYPARLEGEAIPRPVRAFQVADAYDAMTRGRPHALCRSHRDAITELAANAGKHHDPDAVRALRAMGEDGLSSALTG